LVVKFPDEQKEFGQKFGAVLRRNKMTFRYNADSKEWCGSRSQLFQWNMILSLITSEDTNADLCTVYGVECASPAKVTPPRFKRRRSGRWK
jgi:hypothetical protein